MQIKTTTWCRNTPIKTVKTKQKKSWKLGNTGSHVHCRWGIKWFAPLENSLDVSHEAKHWESTRQWHWTSYQNIQVGWVYNMGGKVSLKKSRAVWHCICSRAGKGKTSVVTRNQGLQGPGSAEREKGGCGYKRSRWETWVLWDALDLNGWQQTDKPIWWQSHINEIHTNIYTHTERERKIERRSPKNRETE